ncbi:hypothetical protein UFOVP28_58 [uncultured Caudovirales phage]|uniref:Uncharacterized protein n=1 Tax=uncultured Caudovirales phage TaxID=2100421 RepID=A0A6J5KND1_9CAUD|nr:hypothetical protein UFOVP28_58 [uncultured Caudovirales phage]
MLQNNIAQQSGLISRLSDSQLNQELSRPSGMAPTYLVMSEIQKRQAMRQGGMPSGAKLPVKDQMLQGAVAPAPTMPQSPGPANVDRPLPVAGPAMVGSSEPAGGIPALAAMSRVAGQGVRLPVGYNQSTPPTYANGGVVRFDDGGMVDDDGLVAPVTLAAHRMAPVPISPGASVALPGFNALPASLTQAAYHGVTPLDMAQSYEAADQRYLSQNGIMAPRELNDIQHSIYKNMGGDTAFTSPYDPAIAQYKEQMQGVNPMSQALIKAGAAMMQAPNGSLLAGLGAGLNAGGDAYQSAQAQQRAVQDKMIQAQMAQGVAKVNGMEKAYGLAGQERSDQARQYDAGLNRADAYGKMVSEAPLALFKAKDEQAARLAQIAATNRQITASQQESQDRIGAEFDLARNNATAKVGEAAQGVFQKTIMDEIAARKAAKQKAMPTGMTLTPQQEQEIAQQTYQQMAPIATNAAFRASLGALGSVRDRQGNALESAFVMARGADGKPIVDPKTGRPRLAWNPLIAPYAGALDPNKASDRAYVNAGSPLQ